MLSQNFDSRALWDKKLTFVAQFKVRNAKTRDYALRNEKISHPSKIILKCANHVFETKSILMFSVESGFEIFDFFFLLLLEWKLFSF